MSASRTRFFGAMALAGLLAASGTVLAQSSTPRDLRPGAATANAGQGGVRVNRLDAPGIGAAGILSQSEGGLPADLWQGSDRETIAALLRRLPDRYTSPAARDLARRLLLTVGALPAGTTDDAEILSLRIRGVLHAGDAEGAVALAEAAGGSGAAGPVAEPMTEALFALGEEDRACGTVQGQIRLGGRGYWQRASVFCDIRAGQIDAADLTLSVLSETGEGSPTFTRLAQGLMDVRPARLDGSDGAGALELAMALAAPSMDLANAGDMAPWLGKRLTTAGAVNSDGRIEAGIAGVRGAGLTPSLVMLLFGNQVEPAGAPFRGPVVTAMTATTSIVRAEALNDLWSAAGTPSDRIVAAAFAAGFLKRIEADAALAFFAPVAMRMHLLNGEMNAAQSWANLVRRAAGTGELAAGETARAEPLLRLARQGGADMRLIGLWLDAELAEGGDRDRALAMLMAMDGLGRAADDTVWQRLISAGSPEAASASGGGPLWRQLVMASGAGRRGESVLAALTLLGARDAASLSPVELATVTGAIRRAGLGREARQIALEAAIGRGG